MECNSIFDCPMGDDFFLEQVEAHVKDFPLRMNEPRLLHRCDISLSLKGHENLVRDWLFDHRMTRRRCEALRLTHTQWVRRVNAYRAFMDDILGQKSSATWAR